MTADDVIIDAGLELVRAFTGRPYAVAVARHPLHGIRLEARHTEHRDLEAIAYLNAHEVLEFPHLNRVEGAVADVVAYIDALEGHPDEHRLGAIPNGRIPAFDKARADGTTRAPGRPGARPWFAP